MPVSKSFGGVCLGGWDLGLVDLKRAREREFLVGIGAMRWRREEKGGGGLRLRKLLRFCLLVLLTVRHRRLQ